MGRNAETYRIVPVYPLPIRVVSHLKMMLLRRRHGIPQEYQDLRIDPQPLLCWLGPVREAVPVASAAPCLQWKDDGDRVEVFRLDADEVFVGRREDAGLVSQAS